MDRYLSIEVSMLKDIATLTIDTSGAGLHKRGYRLDQGEAPLKETLAAALIKLNKLEAGSAVSLILSVDLVQFQLKRH